ncbi:MAG: T9SS type A sorting domain-containing protein [Bacteroidota bacterium]
MKYNYSNLLKQLRAASVAIYLVPLCTAGIALPFSAHAAANTISGAAEMKATNISKPMVSLTFYSKPSGSLNTPSTWNTAADGSGVDCSDLSFAGQQFIYTRTSGTLSADFPDAVNNVTGFKIGDAANGITASLTIGMGVRLGATVDVDAGSALTLTDEVPALGTLQATSTVNFSQSADVNIPNGTYGNLALRNGNKFFGFSPEGTPVLVVQNNLTITSGALAYPKTTGAGTAVLLGGNLSLSALGHIYQTPVSAFNTSDTKNGLIVVTSGNALQTIGSANDTVSLDHLVSTKTAGGITISSNTTLLFGSRGGLSQALNFSGTAAYLTGSTCVVSSLPYADGRGANMGSTEIILAGTASVRLNTSTEFSTANLTVSAFGNSIFRDNASVQYVHGNLSLDGNRRSGGGSDNYNLTGILNLINLPGDTGTIYIRNNSTDKGTIIPSLGTLELGPVTAKAGFFFNNNSMAATANARGGKIIMAGNLIVAEQLTGTDSLSFVDYGSDTVVLSGNYINNRIDLGSDQAPLKSTFLFIGTSSQAIVSNRPQGNFYNLIMGKRSGMLTLTYPIQILNSLTVMDSGGTFDQNSQRLRLVSSATNTARIYSVSAPVKYINNSQTIWERFMPGYNRTTTGTWYFTGSPVKGQTIEDIKNSGVSIYGMTGATYTGTKPSVWFYNPLDSAGAPLTIFSDSGWQAGTNITNPINPGQGARIWFDNDFFNGPAKSKITLTGTPQVGNITIPVSYCSENCTYTANGNGWNFVANPYPCEIDWSAGHTGSNAGWTKTHIDSAIYVYRQGGSSYMVYAAGISSPAYDAENPATSGINRYIPSGHGFFVHANAANPVLKATEFAKVTPENINASSFLRTQPESMFRIALSNGSTLKDECVIRFKNGTSNGFDNQYDALKLESPGISVSTIPVTGSNMVINTMPEPANHDTLALRVLTSAKGIYTFSFNELDNMYAGLNIYLKDRMTNAITRMSTQNNRYSFSVTEDARSFAANRFSLVYTVNSVTGISASAAPSFIIFPNPSAGETQVNVSGFTGNVNISVTDMLGRNVHTSSILADAQNKKLDAALPAGVYNVKCSSATESVSLKLVIQ